MADVLSVLAKLPPACMLWENDQAYIIRRGVAGKHKYPLTSANDVTIWNYERKVSPEQVTAMDNGATFGWDCAGADLKRAGGDTTFIYSAPLQVMLSVNSNFEEDAAEIASASLDKLLEYLGGISNDHVLTILRDGKLDLLEEHKNVVPKDDPPNP